MTATVMRVGAVAGASQAGARKAQLSPSLSLASMPRPPIHVATTIRRGDSLLQGGAGWACPARGLIAARPHTRTMAASSTAAGLSQYESAISPTKIRETHVAELSEGLWCFTQKFQPGGDKIMPFTTGQAGLHMYVVRLASGELLVLNPIGPTEELVALLKNIGSPSYIAVPSCNAEHTFAVADFCKAFPEAELHAVEYASQQEGFPPFIKLTSETPAAWATDLDQVVCTFPPPKEGKGLAALPFNECTFFLKKQGAALFTDTIVVLSGKFIRTWLDRFLVSRLGVVEDGLTTIFFKPSYDRIPEEGRRWADAVSSWDIKAGMGHHGEPQFPLSTGSFRNAFSSLYEE